MYNEIARLQAGVATGIIPLMSANFVHQIHRYTHTRSSYPMVLTIDYFTEFEQKFTHFKDI